MQILILGRALFVLHTPCIQFSDNSEPDVAKNKHNRNYKQVTKSRSAIRFAMQFLVDVSIAFNSRIHQQPQHVSNLAPPALITCYKGLELIIQQPELFDQPNDDFKEICISLKCFSRRWKAGSEFFHWSQSYLAVNKVLTNGISFFDGIIEFLDVKF